MIEVRSRLGFQGGPVFRSSLYTCILDDDQNQGGNDTSLPNLTSTCPAEEVVVAAMSEDWCETGADKQVVVVTFVWWWRAVI